MKATMRRLYYYNNNSIFFITTTPAVLCASTKSFILINCIIIIISFGYELDKDRRRGKVSGGHPSVRYEVPLLLFTESSWLRTSNQIFPTKVLYTRATVVETFNFFRLIILIFRVYLFIYSLWYLSSISAKKNWSRLMDGT